MDKINNVLEKEYSFKGTHLLLGGLLILALMILFSCMGGRHGGKKMMRDHDMRGGRQQMMQDYNRQDMKRSMMRGQNKQSQAMTQDQASPEPTQTPPTPTTSGATAQ